MKQLTDPKRYTLAEVQKQFSSWRQSKTHRSIIPEELWEAAVVLSDQTPPYKIAKALRLNYSDFIKHIDNHRLAKQGSAITEPHFIELPLPLSGINSECVVEMENRHGDKMKMYLSANQPFDLQELGRSFWRADS